jgi:hypothetical protein
MKTPNDYHAALVALRKELDTKQFNYQKQSIAQVAAIARRYSAIYSALRASDEHIGRNSEYHNSSIEEITRWLSNCQKHPEQCESVDDFLAAKRNLRQDIEDFVRLTGPCMSTNWA